MQILKSYINSNSPTKRNSILNTLKWTMYNSRVVTSRFRKDYIQVILKDNDKTLYACNFYITKCKEYKIYKLIHK